jgi:hypothetical protein
MDPIQYDGRADQIRGRILAPRRATIPATVGYVTDPRLVFQSTFLIFVILQNPEVTICTKFNSLYSEICCQRIYGSHVMLSPRWGQRIFPLASSPDRL